MTAAYLSTACPTPITFSDFLRIQDAGSLTNGNAPISYSVLQGDPLPSNRMRQNALRGDLQGRYAPCGIHAVCTGLALSPPTSGLTLTVGYGHALMDGVVENPTANVVAIPDNTTRVFVWMDKGTPTSTPNFYAVPTSSVAPSGTVIFLGSVSTTSGVITGPDTSGVFYNMNGVPKRWTADTGAPTDAPNAAIQFFSQSNGNTTEYRWNGTQYIPQTTSTPTPVTDPFAYTTASLQTIGATTATATLTPAASTVTQYELKIIGRQNAGTAGFQANVIVAFRSQGGTAFLVGASIPTINSSTDNIGYGATAVASGANVLVKVTGGIGDTVNWAMLAQSYSQS